MAKIRFPILGRLKAKINKALFANRALRRYGWLALGAALTHLNVVLTAATFPVLDAETRLPGNGPVRFPDNRLVAISGDTALVGNLVYVCTQAGWLFQQVLNGSGAVALEGDTAVVGTNIFVRSGTRWELQGTLPFPSGYWCIALDQDLIAVGMAYEAVYVFERSNSVWLLQSRLVASDATNYMLFGASIALDGGRIVVGAPGNLSLYQGTGRAYVFLRNGDSWVQEAKLTNDSSGLNFGSAVAVSGETIAVAANDSATPVTVFVRQSGQWLRQQSLPLGGSWSASYANPFALRADALAVSDLNGAIHLFNRSGSTWNKSQTLTSGSTTKLGPAIGLETNAIIVGTPLVFQSGVANNHGAWIFEPRAWVWQEQDIGNVGALGSLVTSTNVLTVSGGGADIGGTADAFHFIFRPYTNDLEMTVRVASVGGSDLWSRGGIMFRGSLDAGAPFVFVSQRKGEQITFQSRSAPAAEADFRPGPWVGIPYWLKLRKLGSNFVASVSQDGSSWYDIATANVGLSKPFYIGLAVTSHQPGILATDVFDHVAIAPIALPRAATDLMATADGIDRINLSWTDNSDNESAFVVKHGSTIAILPPNTTNFTATNLAHNSTYSYIVQAIEPHGYGPDSNPASATTLKLPPPWLDRDIGAVQVPGDARYSGPYYPYLLSSSGFVVTSGATNSSVDGLHFVYRPWAGDFDFRARPWIYPQNATGTKAGLMIRASLDSTSSYAFAYVTEIEGDGFVTRNLPGANAVVTSGYWGGEFRIVRRGNTFTVFNSDHALGRSLVRMTEQTINLPSTVYLGFAVSGQDRGQPLVGGFSDVYLAGGSDVHPISAPVLSATPLSPNQVHLSWVDSNVNPINYQVFYVETNNYPYYEYYYVNSGWAPSNATFSFDTSIIPGMTRNYRIRVRLADGDWIWSNFAPATTPLPTFNLPASWQMTRIGAGLGGTATVTESTRTFSIWGSGSGISGQRDNCSGVFRLLTGDGSITARFLGAVDSTGITYPAGKFGIMIRQSLDPAAPTAAAFGTKLPYSGFGFMSRTSTGATSVLNTNGSYTANWLKLVRTGLSFVGYSSRDGATWTQLGSASISMTDPVLTGLFVESENSPVLVSASFDNLQVAPPQAPALAFEGFGNGNAQIRLESFPGWTNRIEVSPDLVHWELLTNRFNISGLIDITDPAALRNSSRFYRARIEY